MINTYMNVSAQELIEGCLQPDEEAWWAFYERFGGMLQRALRRALGARAALTRSASPASFGASGQNVAQI